MSNCFHSVVCADCGIDVEFEDQFAVPDPETKDDHKIICPRCARKYGIDVDSEIALGKLDKERWG